MDITKLTLVELKSLAYDILAELERLQNNLRIVQARIVEVSKEETKDLENERKDV